MLSLALKKLKKKTTIFVLIRKSSRGLKQIYRGFLIIFFVRNNSLLNTSC